MTSTSTLPPHKSALLDACLEARCLTFGTFNLKSGRKSPYFFNAGQFHTGKLLTVLSNAFAVTIAQHSDPEPLQFDIVFGPAYKGIPLCCTTVEKLYGLDERRFGHVSYAFDRKSAKTYGDKGNMVGGNMEGKKVLIIDDVITAGTACKEAMQFINSQGGQVVGVVLALNRQEKAPPPQAQGLDVDGARGLGDDDGKPRMSAIGEIRKSFGVPVVAVLTLDDIIEGYRAVGTAEDIQRLEEYREKYRPAD